MNRKALIFLFPIVLTSCIKSWPFKRNPPQLPAMTCVGEEVVGCLRNGEVFLPCFTGLSRPNPGFGFYLDTFNGYNPRISLSFECGVEDVRLFITLDTMHRWSSGTYSLQQELDTMGRVIAAAKYFNRDKGQGYYSCMPGMFGELVITNIDTVDHVVCGTFAFDAVHENTNDTVRIRSGRFDEKY